MPRTKDNVQKSADRAWGMHKASMGEGLPSRAGTYVQQGYGEQRSRMSVAAKVTKQEALAKALVIIDQFVVIAKNGRPAEVTIGTFQDIGIIRCVAERLED